MALKIENWVMLPVLVYFIFVQLNDVDAIKWVFFYGYGFVITILALRNIYTPFALVGMVGYFIGAVVYIPGWNWDTVMLLTEPKMNTNDVELAREGFGLFLVGLWMIVPSVVWFRRRNQDPAAVPKPTTDAE